MQRINHRFDMMMIMKATFGAILCMLVGCSDATVSNERGVVTLSGAVDTPLRLSAADVAALPHIAVRARDRGDEEHEFEGVELHELLARAGIVYGSEVKGRGKAYTSHYLLARGADGHTALYSLVELDTSFSSYRILLADRRDGVPLPEGDGPFRIIVTDEKRRSRWVRDVRGLEVGVVE